MREIVGAFCHAYKAAERATDEFLDPSTRDTQEKLDYMRARRDLADELLEEARKLLFYSVGEKP
jgi:hypothetical protein